MPERGFTLLEIMLVIFLIGLASAGVVQTFATDSESPAKKAAQDFLTRFAQFKDRAVIEGQTLGVLIDAPGYQFMQRRQGQWSPVSSTRLSAQVTVPKQVQMLLQPGSDIWQKEYPCCTDGSNVPGGGFQPAVARSYVSAPPAGHPRYDGVHAPVGHTSGFS